MCSYVVANSLSADSLPELPRNVHSYLQTTRFTTPVSFQIGLNGPRCDSKITVFYETLGFINYDLLRYCEEEKITFTRSRAYRKNDQAHVEEKNGSVVRRLVGYDRYEGTDAWRALTALYAVLRLYVNFFQPSVKLLSKERKEGRTTKRYDKAQTSLSAHSGLKRNRRRS